MTDKIVEQVAGLELIGMAARALDGHIAFKMALHANRVSPFRWKLNGINYRRSFCASGIDDVSCAWSVAALTANAILSEKGRRVFVLRAFERRLHPAGVALQATGVGGQVHGDFTRVAVGWSHIPNFAVGVPVDGRLEKEIIHSKQITPAAVAGTNEVK